MVRIWNSAKSFLGSLVCVLIMLGAYTAISGGLKTAPAHALVWVDPIQGIYYAPSCVDRDQRIGLQIATIQEVHISKLSPDPKCKSQVGFVEETRSPAGRLAERLGLLRPLPERWNADGTWNW